MILKVLIIFDPKLNLFKSYAYIFVQQSRCSNKWDHLWSFRTTSTKKANVYEKLLRRWMSRNTMAFKYDRVGNDFYVYVENNFND